MIKITEEIYWDPDNLENIEAREWITKEVMKQDPTLDKFGRPTHWELETETAKVKVTREYINPNSGSWAKKKDIIEVSEK